MQEKRKPLLLARMLTFRVLLIWRKYIELGCYRVDEAGKGVILGIVGVAFWLLFSYCYELGERASFVLHHFIFLT